MMVRRAPVILGLVLTLAWGQVYAVDYSREVRPILSDHCFPCHGPDRAARKGGLRLDLPEEAFRARRTGSPAITPGRPDLSQVISRITSTQPAEMMPPPEAHKALTQAHKTILRQWIAEGASYTPHWAFAPVRRPSPPEVRHGGAANPIDRFLRARLEREGFRPAPEADRTTLLRRVTLDLTGLPPSVEDVLAFLKEERSDAYEIVVDRLLASTAYGERMAVDWLDAARYADTNGYQVDRDRLAYAWRDWVIAAYNANMPFDRFTIEQLAGDLLPQATRDQKIATGFHRNHMMNEEGGIIPEEFLAEYTADRVETTAAVWLGQTFTCCRCHDHKYDPFTQIDYYRLKAFFHNVPERGVGNYGADIRVNSPPQLPLPAPALDAELTRLHEELASAERQVFFEELRLGKAAESGKAKTRVAEVRKQLTAAQARRPTALVMEEMGTPRPTHVLMRGAYDQKGALVTPGTPAALPPLQGSGPINRLALAHWLVAAENPLPSRVVANRLWQAIFGTGLVRTSEDFGVQGEPPSHPELLDWLASELVASGWDIKHLLRLMVTSAAYRQSSRLSPEIAARDPDNRLMARAPRFRLHAEFLRDSALASSGLLVRRLGGPSVRPYHPPGLYEQVVAGSGASTYVLGTGEELYRRSLYSYWKRSVPNPASLLFDAPFRETCTLRRSRTNTPLQALNRMNDTTYVEAARFLGARMLREGGADVTERLRRGFLLTLARNPQPGEFAVLLRTYQRARREYAADPQAARALLAVGATHADPSLDLGDLAAATTVASLLLNLDETLTRE